MWVKKTERELIEEKKKSSNFSFKAPLIVAFTFLFITILADFLGQSAISTWKPKSLFDIINNPVKYLIWSVGSFFITSVYQLWNKKNLFQNDNDVMICEICYMTKNRDGSLNCQCGGKFIEIHKMKWVEDKS